ncbi:hypothetical protein NXH64_10695 [Butyrivibrio fibrisolvens]|uniref:hypothetical protein n=1 Tax=Pseudobutyrivibrio ruminis TaxID=46206 RepID=UPI00040EFC24|nr:hypothetical protein [Pseudobutyrivibrio ruminis]MDC7279966.1 hypothetical protein [Butyrivibrio fibrisolvens]
MSSLPEGELRIYPNGKYYRWYYSKDGKTTFLDKSKKDLAQELSRKKYLSLKNSYLLAEYKFLQMYYEDIEEKELALEQFLTQSGYSQLLSSTTCNNDNYHDWMTEKFISNPKYAEHLTYVCPSGNRVRSKSEQLIDIVLSQHNIPYRYECELVIGNVTFYPDFTILHPITKQLFYWEHFGKMDDYNYSKNALAKIKTFQEHGLIAGKNLILTFESSEHPFTYKDAEAALVQMHI